MKKLVYVIFMGCLIAGTAVAKDMTSVETQMLVKSGQSWNGQALPDYPTGKPEITILKITIPPGAKLPMHLHPVINCGVLLKGTLTVITEEGRTLMLKAGDPIVEVVDTKHFGQNDGPDPAEIIVFYVGVKDQPITIKY